MPTIRFRDTPAWHRAALATVLATYVAVVAAMILAPGMRSLAALLGANSALLVAIILQARRPLLLAATEAELSIAGVVIDRRQLGGVRLVTAGGRRGERVRTVLIDGADGRVREIPLGAYLTPAWELGRVLAKAAPSAPCRVIADPRPASARPPRGRPTALQLALAGGALALAIAGLALVVVEAPGGLDVVGGIVGAALLPVAPAVIANAVMPAASGRRP